MPFISQKNIWFCGVRYEMLKIYLVCEWKLFSADDWSSDCRCHGCVSCVQFSVRIRCDLCSTLSPLPLFILTNLHMNVWVWSLLEVLTVCSQWERTNDTRNRGPPHAKWHAYCSGNNEHVSGEQVEGWVLRMESVWEVETLRLKALFIVWHWGHLLTKHVPLIVEHSHHQNTTQHISVFIQQEGNQLIHHTVSFLVDVQVV